MTAPIKIAKNTKVSIKAKAIKEVLNKFSASSGFLAAPTLYPANNTPVPIAAPDKVTEIKPNAINLEAVIANKLRLQLHKFMFINFVFYLYYGINFIVH